MKKIFTFLMAGVLLAACSDNDPDYIYDVNWEDSVFVEFDRTVGFTVDQSGYHAEEIEVDAPLGWTVTPTTGFIAIKAPSGDDKKDYVTSGKVTLSANVSGNSFKTSINVYTGIVVDFEDVPQNILAVDAYGANFYNTYGEGQYTEYTDEKSGLYFSINEGEDWETKERVTSFGFGGTAFSTWNKDLTTNDYLNQCTINYTNTSGYGGLGNSKVFALVFSNATISFKEEEFVVDHIYAMNTVYATLAMKNGNDYANALEDGGFFYVTITGTGSSGTKSVDFYLADFRKADSPGIIDEWTKVDLSGLGKVNKLEFSFNGSDTGQWGLNTPKYFCFDNVAIRK